VNVKRQVLDAALVGIAWIILGGLACWGLAILVELVAAAWDHLSPLPPPSSWWIRGAVAIAALLIGTAATVRWLHRRGRWWPHVAAAAAVCVVFACALFVVHLSTEHDYLTALPASARVGAADDTLLAEGHAACSWLGQHRWGQPPELTGRYGQYYGARFAPFNPTERGSNSTTRYYAWYINHVDAQQPGPLTPAETVRAKVAPVAWLHLCHFQQWVHRPIGGSGGGD
jgi:hypothetical protein